MEQNESNLSFDQLPKAVGELLAKVDYVISRLDEKKEVDGSSPTQDDDQMMTSVRPVSSLARNAPRCTPSPLSDASHTASVATSSTSSRRNSLSGYKAEGHTTSLIHSPSRNRQSSMPIWSRCVRKNGTSQPPSNNNDSYIRRWDMAVPLPH